MNAHSFNQIKMGMIIRHAVQQKITFLEITGQSRIGGFECVVLYTTRTDGWEVGYSWRATIDCSDEYEVIE